MSDAIRLSINPPQIAVDPGGFRDLVLQIENRTDVVDEFTLEFLGDAASWATPDRNPVAIFAKGSESVTVKLRPPRASFPVAGTVPLGIRVRSTMSPDISSVEECRVELNPFVEVAAEIRPKTSKGRFGATHRLRIINRGNSKAVVSLQADVQQGDCTIALPQSPLVVAAGERVTTRIKVRPSESHFTGPEEFHQFRVNLQPQGAAQSVSVDATMRQRAVFQVPTTLLVTAALLLAGAYVVYGKGLPNAGLQPHSNAVSSPSAVLASPVARASATQTQASPVATPQVSPSAAPPPPSPTPLVVQSVAFAPNGNSPPIVTVNGINFGAPPTGVGDNSTNCGSYTNNGQDFGNNLWLQAGNFASFGQGTPPTGSCVGLTITNWSNTHAVFTFGNAYRSFDHWYLSAGDSYVLFLKGTQFPGTVAFPGPSIQSVRFSKTGNSPPVVTVTGTNFGPQPAGTNDNPNACGSYGGNNGQDFGDSLWVQAGNFAAFGQGSAPSGACVGLIITSWSATQAVFTFGSAYASYDHWYISPGDSYVLHFLGVQFSGTVSFA